MAKPYAEKFYNSRTWRRTSKAYANSVNNLCERCLKNGDRIPYKIVHHKIHITEKNIDDANITLNWNNLEAVCKRCHDDEHFNRVSSTVQGSYFDDDGNFIAK